jgi:hypothetical protein
VELIAEAPRSEHIREWLTQNLAEVRDRLMVLMQQAQASGEIDESLDPGAIAHVMIALYHGFITQKLIDPSLDAASYSQVVAALFGGSFWRGAANESGDTGAALRH